MAGCSLHKANTIQVAGSSPASLVPASLDRITCVHLDHLYLRTIRRNQSTGISAKSSEYMAYQGIEIAQLRAQQEALNKQLAEAKERETLLVLNEIVQKMGEYGISVSELTGRKVGVHANELAAKYRDPVSGSTWSGRGRAPAWIAGKDRNEFLMDKRAASHARAQAVLFSEGH